MGTRNLTCVQYNGEYKVAQYCQWDGYPRGQGLTILNFLRKNLDKMDVFAKKLARCRFIEKAEHEALWVECGASPNCDGVSMEISKKFCEKYPSLHRDTGAKVLDLIMDGEGDLPLTNQIDFAGQSLFCEWAYVIDLDRSTFEVYRGFNKRKPAKNARFGDYAHADPDGEYTPVRLKAKFRFDQIPLDDEEFFKKCGTKTGD